MLKIRVIPVLLLYGNGLTKTVKFANEKYVGDPFNAVRIFNEKEVNELIFLDITATVENRPPRFDFLHEMAGECFMPLCYGGGIRTLREIEKIFNAGIEKISINAGFFENSDIIRQSAKEFGSQSIVVSMDVKKDSVGNYSVYTYRGKKNQKMNPVSAAKMAEDLGAGEMLLNSIDKDGTQSGYDLEIIETISKAINIPLIVCGGAGELTDFRKAVDAGASSVAAGSFFVFYGKYRAVLITYPEIMDIEKLFYMGANHG